MNTKSAYLEASKIDLIELYSTGKSFKQISEQYNVSKDTLRAYFEKWGVKSRITSSGWDKPIGNNRQYTRNSLYFSVPAQENSYWAGFIAADGNITDYGSLRLALDHKDYDALVNFRESIQFSGKIHTYKYNRAKPGEYSRIEICDPIIVRDLGRIWNIYPRKTFTLLPPNIMEVQQVIPFIIGYIDGDGSIGKQRNSTLIQICGNLLFLSWVRECISLFSDLEFKNSISKSKSIYSLRFQGSQADKFIKDTYKVYSGFRLKRKWKNEKYI